MVTVWLEGPAIPRGGSMRGDGDHAVLGGRRSSDEPGAEGQKTHEQPRHRPDVVAPPGGPSRVR